MSELDDTRVTPVPQEISDKFNEVFSNASAADNAEAGLPSGTTVQTDDQAGRSSGRQREYAKQQADELEQEGIVSADNPDGAPKTEAEEAAPEVDAEGKPVAKTEEVAAVTDESKIDSRLRFVANELGWTNDKIDRLFKADPEIAQETLERLADTYTNLSRQFLSGVGSPVAQGTQQQTATPAQPTSPTSQLEKFYSQIEAFAETNGEDLANFAKALKAELIDPVQKVLAANEAAAQELSATEARSTLADLRKDFGVFYGTGETMSETELKNVQLLSEVADQLRTGAQKQGRELSVKEAIKRAHGLITVDHQKQIARKEIKGQVQTRSRSISAPPTQRIDPKLQGGRSHATALEATSRKMAELGIEEY